MALANGHDAPGTWQNADPYPAIVQPAHFGETVPASHTAISALMRAIIARGNADKNVNNAAAAPLIGQAASHLENVDAAKKLT